MSEIISLFRQHKAYKDRLSLAIKQERLFLDMEKDYWKALDDPNCLVQKNTRLYSYYTWHPYLLMMLGEVIIPLFKIFCCVLENHVTSLLSPSNINMLFSPFSFKEAFDFLKTIDTQKRIKIFEERTDIVTQNLINDAIDSNDYETFVSKITLIANLDTFLKELKVAHFLYMLTEFAKEILDRQEEIDDDSNFAEVFSETNLLGFSESFFSHIETIIPIKQSFEDIMQDYYGDDYELLKEGFETVLKPLIANADIRNESEVNEVRRIWNEYEIPTKLWRYVADIALGYSSYIIRSVANDNLSAEELRAMEDIYNNSRCPTRVKAVIRYWDRIFKDSEEETVCTSPSTEQPTIEQSNDDALFIDPKNIQSVEAKPDEYFKLTIFHTDYEKLQKFINGIASYGYIDNDLDTKRLFFFRLTGRAKPKKLGLILWKKHPKVLLHFLKFFYDKQRNKYDKLFDFFCFEDDYKDWIEDWFIKKESSKIEQTQSSKKDYGYIIETIYPDFENKY